MVLAAAVAFVGTHVLLWHPLRRPLVQRMGEAAFAALYSLVAFVMLGWLILAYRSAPASAAWWPVGDTLWAIATGRSCSSPRSC